MSLDIDNRLEIMLYLELANTRAKSTRMEKLNDEKVEISFAISFVTRQVSRVSNRYYLHY